MKRRPLGTTGLQVSELSFGAAPLGNVYGTVDAATGEAAVRAALDLGINLFDAAPFYGLTAAESALGRALRGVDRDDYLLTTKVGRYGERDFDFSADRVTRSVDESLARLGTDRIDVIQCHDVEFGDLRRIADETVPALHALRDAGKVRFVGVTGYTLPALAWLVDRGGIDTVMTYCEYTLQDRRLALFKDRFPASLNASPLGMGALSGRGAPSWHPAPPDVLRACDEAAAYCRSRGADLAKLALQFAVATADQAGAATTVVGSADPANVARNVSWIADPIDPELLAGVESILAGVRDVGWTSGLPENQRP
ncbi:aldo/keto reductase [Catenuloplanes japonicus]|uniref:aldo/keto reductase n=1 Tax=Catenuloplanes japonicus TaxID=33876 RepID=UPI000524C9BF|nr:aldo/keto reductase [Catenuloplanes japonicus]